MFSIFHPWQMCLYTDLQASFEFRILGHFQGLCPPHGGVGGEPASGLCPASFHFSSLPYPSSCSAQYTLRGPSVSGKVPPTCPSNSCSLVPLTPGAWGSAEAFAGPGSGHRILLAGNSRIRSPEHGLELCSETQQPLCGHWTLVEMCCRCKACAGLWRLNMKREVNILYSWWHIEILIFWIYWVK